MVFGSGSVNVAIKVQIVLTVFIVFFVDIYWMIGNGYLN